MAFVRSNIEWKRRCDFLGVELTNRTEDLVHAKRHIAEQEKELQGLELQVLHCMDNGAGPAKKRRRKEKKVEFDPAVVAAAGELAHEREQRALEKDLDRKRLELEKAKRGLVRTHPCA